MNIQITPIALPADTEQARQRYQTFDIKQLIKVITRVRCSDPCRSGAWVSHVGRMLEQQIDCARAA